MNDISVLGIFVADISFFGPKIPAVGETILGNKYNVGPGGKGCNQAIAIARLGAQVNFISKVGKDFYGELAMNTLKENNINSVIHLAAYLNIKQSEKYKKKYFKNNVGGTLNLVKACRGTSVKNIIFSSSCCTSALSL